MKKGDNIISLDPREFTRLKPNVYCGSTEDTIQLLIEVFSNAVDEFNTGVCKDITVKYVKENGFIYIEDSGRGFPINETREDGKTTLEAAFSVLNTSGKYDETGVYAGSSLGCYGIGSKLVNFLSKSCTVKSFRNGKYEKIYFKDGLFQNREVKEMIDKNKHGTIVQYLPDPQFFDHVQINEKVIKNLFKTISCICARLTIYFEIYETEDHLTMCEGEFYKYYCPEGIAQLVDEVIKDKKIVKNNFIYVFEEGKNKADIVMNYQDSYSSTIVPYVNTGLTESGQHITQFKTILTREFNKFFKEKKWLKEKDGNLSGDEIQEGMYCVFNLTIPGVGYDAQIKSRITKIDTSIVYSKLGDTLQAWFAQNEKDIKKIFDRAVTARKAKEAAKKARDAVRGKTEKKQKSILNLPTKLVDAWSKDRQKCELLITEGDSAASGLVGARDGEFQAVFPIRGKIINLYKNSDEKIFANQEVVNIIKAIGLDLDIKNKKMIYDKNKLRYGKIILCCDGDEDGKNIKNLLFTYFWSLCPELLLNKHIYIAIPPLFRITTSKNQYIYLKDGIALEEYKNNHRNEKFLINRNKGLGEQDPQELEECLLNPLTRNVSQIIVDDKEYIENMFEILMGKSVPPRREYILKYSGGID